MSEAKKMFREAAEATKEGLTEVRKQLADLPPSGKMTRQDRLDQIQLLKHEKELTRQHREALEEQLSMTRQMNNRKQSMKESVDQDNKEKAAYAKTEKPKLEGMKDSKDMNPL